MEFTCRASAEGRLEIGTFNRARFVEFLRENPNALVKVSTILPESSKQRRYLEGSIIPLVTYYQEGLDHRSSEDCAKVREWLKLEFNSEAVVVGGKRVVMAKSTKGSKELNAFMERVVDWLTENYDPPLEAMDPDAYKLWRDTIMPFGGPDNYIDHLVETGILKPR